MDNIEGSEIDMESRYRTIMLMAIILIILAILFWIMKKQFTKIYGF